MYKRNKWILGAAGALVLLVGATGAQRGKLPPSSAGVPKVQQKALDFTLPDQNGQSVRLSEALAASKKNSNAPAVVLIFYRGYW